ncbi:MAG: hypothetical protein AAGM84_06780 [Pseudomonadota bacterium]
MSAHTTNIQKQTRRHWGAIAGIALCIGFVAALALYMFVADPDGAIVDQASPVASTDG